MRVHDTQPLFALSRMGELWPALLSNPCNESASPLPQLIHSPFHGPSIAAERTHRSARVVRLPRDPGCMHLARLRADETLRERLSVSVLHRCPRLCVHLWFCAWGGCGPNSLVGINTAKPQSVAVKD